MSEYTIDKYDSFEKFKTLIKESHAERNNAIKALVYSNPSIKDLILKMGLDYQESKQVLYNIGRGMHILTIYYNEFKKKYFIEDEESPDIELSNNELDLIYQSMFKYYNSLVKPELSYK